MTSWQICKCRDIAEHNNECSYNIKYNKITRLHHQFNDLVETAFIYLILQNFQNRKYNYIIFSLIYIYTGIIYWLSSICYVQENSTCNENENHSIQTSYKQPLGSLKQVYYTEYYNL